MAYRIPAPLKEWIPDGVSSLPSDSFALVQAAWEYKGYCLHKNDPTNIARRRRKPAQLLPDWEMRRLKDAREIRMACIRAALAAMGK